MHRLARIALVALTFGGVVCAPLSAPRAAYAQEGAKLLTIGNVPLFLIRNGDTLNGKEMSVQDRINRIQDVYAKYLGGQNGKITSKKWGDRVHLYLNGDFVLAVTPADAKATHHKTAETLAPVWAAELQRGYDGAHTPSTGSAKK